MAIKKQAKNKVYGSLSSSPVLQLFPDPIILTGATNIPVATDDGYLGQVVINKTNATAYMLVQDAAGASNWQSLTGATGLTPVTISATGLITTTGNITTTGTGSITSATTLTATLGNITATNGNVILGTVGNSIKIKQGNAASGASAGQATLTGVTPVVITVTGCTAASAVLVSLLTPAGTPGVWTIVPTTGSFSIVSSTAETSTFSFLVVNAA
jgi:hypothetical protein